MASPPATPRPSEDSLNITIHHHGTPHTFTFTQNATLTDLSSAITTNLSIPPAHQKLLISKLGLLKPPYPNPTLPLTSLTPPHKIQLLAPLPSDLADLATAAASAPKPRGPPVLKPAKPALRRDPARVAADATYTFGTILPLAYMPYPERSLAMLQRLAADPGIRTAMRTHKFRVGVLTEMDPAQHTTHESRTLGLNRNAGEVIELRLRTDAGDGYRDYNGVRRTLCHELAHNVFGEHDQRFWALYREIEAEVRRADWKSGGSRVGGREEYVPDEEDHVDGGGWTGGEFVLGGVGDRGSGLGRRELMARAAEGRARRERAVREEAERGGEESGVEGS